MGDVIRIMPSESGAPFDSLRHYIAVKRDAGIKLAAITNGIQTEAIFEAYRLWINLGRQEIAEAPELLHNLLTNAGAEPDSYHTPRIAAVISVPENGIPQAVIGTIGETHGRTDEILVKPKYNGRLTVVSTYNGDMNNPEPNTHCPNLFSYECLAENQKELAKHIFGISAAQYQGEDIRVCSVAGVFANGKWNISIINA